MILFAQNTNRKNLLQLLWLRLIAVMGQLLVIFVAVKIFDIDLPLRQMMIVLTALLIVSLFGFYRYKLQKNISDRSLFFELLFDVFALTAQLYFSGGASNPFISLFLLQVISGAILLRALYSCLIGAITILSYICLSFYNVEIHDFHHDHAADFFSLHLQGMLISYVLAAILVLVFVTKIISNLKDRDRQVSFLKQKTLEQEQITKMGLFATSAAHQLSTPLATIMVVLDDLKKANLAKEIADDVNLMEEQVKRCKKILTEILSSSGKERAGEDLSFDFLIEEWKKSRGFNNLIYKFGSDFNKKIFLNRDLSLAFFSIFDNALEASAAMISVNILSLENLVKIIVEDNGKGFDEEVLNNIGKINFTTKSAGNSGLGLFLAINSFANVDGSLKVSNRSEGGAKVEITIPLANL